VWSARLVSCLTLAWPTVCALAGQAAFRPPDIRRAALRRRGRCGVLYVDGDADFYQPEVNPLNGAASASDLAFATGRPGAPWLPADAA
jgi:hypothetical protein